MGTQWAVELATQRPQLATHVVAVAPVVDDEHRSIVAQAVALGIDSLGEPVSGNLLVFSDYLRCGQSWFLNQMRHMLAYRIADRVGDLHAPLLILRGGRDRIVGMGWCRRLRHEAHPVALVTVPGHGHLVQRTAPRAVASAIQAFVSPDASPVSQRDGTD